MKLIDYIKERNITRLQLSKTLGISRVTLNRYINNPDKASILFRLAIEYLTSREVSRYEWDN
jgi:transcriptional regulator with XRE-family HTH domain